MRGVVPVGLVIQVATSGGLGLVLVVDGCDMERGGGGGERGRGRGKRGQGTGQGVACS
jgi:hypothetical protein